MATGPLAETPWVPLTVPSVNALLLTKFKLPTPLAASVPMVFTPPLKATLPPSSRTLLTAISRSRVMLPVLPVLPKVRLVRLLPKVKLPAGMLRPTPLKLLPSGSSVSVPVVCSPVWVSPLMPQSRMSARSTTAPDCGSMFPLPSNSLDAPTRLGRVKP